jgi:hypothetical protein
MWLFFVRTHTLHMTCVLLRRMWAWSDLGHCSARSHSYLLGFTACLQCLTPALPLAGSNFVPILMLEGQTVHLVPEVPGAGEVTGPCLLEASCGAREQSAETTHATDIQVAANGLLIARFRLSARCHIDLCSQFLPQRWQGEVWYEGGGTAPQWLTWLMHTALRSCKWRHWRTGNSPL